MSEADKQEKPAVPPPLISATPAGPRFDVSALMKSPPGGNGLAALGNTPAPAALQMTPLSWFLPPAPLVCEQPRPPVGSFVLDPSLADPSTPEGFATHVLVEPVLPGAFPEPPRYVVLERPVRAAMRLNVYAVRVGAVYTTAMEAFGAGPASFLRTSFPVIVPGETYWTSAGAIVALGSSGDAVFTATPNLDTGAAGSVILLQTDAGFVLVDVGMQTPDAGLAAAVGDELAREVAAYLGTAPLGEAILSRRPPDGHVTPYVGKLVRILTVRGTMDQYQDGSIGAVLAVQNQYRDWYFAGLRTKLEDERASWEATQPIMPNSGIREQRWKQHVEATLASAMRGYQPPALALADAAGAFLQPRDEATTVQPTAFSTDETGALDLTSTEWEPADDEIVTVYGAGKLAIFPAKGILYRPRGTVPAPPPPKAPAPPSSIDVPELRAAGPLGPGLPGDRPVTPWLALAAVGKENQLLVRISEGHGVMVDAGGVPRVAMVRGLASLTKELGFKPEKILLTHPHKDHVRHVLELIDELHLEADDIVVSSAWKKSPIVKALKKKFGNDWKPGLAVEGEGVTALSMSVDRRRIDIYALPEAHAEAQKEFNKVAGGKKQQVDAAKIDRASLLYVIGNESSPSRVAIVGDLRGEDIVDLHDGLTKDVPSGFRDAFKNVRVIQGFGHHLSQAAGRTARDVKGLDLLIDATLHQNGELTILIQSYQSHSFDGPPTTAGPEGALLHYLQRQGVNVVFAGQGDRKGDSSALIDSAGAIATRGPGVRLFDRADPQVREAYDRLDLLREARRTLDTSPDFGPASLGMPDRSAAELRPMIDKDIAALETALKDYKLIAGKELLEARGEKNDAGVNKELGEYLRENPSAAKPAEDVAAALRTKGTVEAGFTEQVLARLRAAVESGKPMSLHAEFGAMPRDVFKTIDKVPSNQLSDEEKSALAEKYRELAELTDKLEGTKVPDKDRFDILERARQLRGELQKTLDKVGTQESLASELRRMDAAIKRLEAGTVKVGEKVSRDALGRLTRTEYIKMRNREIMEGTGEVLGRGMGALMVVHSIEELGGALDDAAKGNGSAPNLALRLTHSAYGVDMGLRMVRGAHVGGGEFVLMSVIEIGIAASGDYDTASERQAAITNAELSAAANLGCMAIGQGVMYASAALPPPFDLVGFGLGLAITFAGDWFLDVLGIREKDPIQELTKDIEPVLEEYHAMIGTQQLAARPPGQLEQLGVKYPEDMHILAEKVQEDHARAVSGKELEVTRDFEKAYAKARKSSRGLEYLDAKAAEFLRLRGLAMRGLPDPNRGELETRWRAMDAKVTFPDADKSGDSLDIEQWDDIWDKLEDIEELLKKPDEEVDRDKLAHALTVMDDLLENARYRVESASRGGLRPDPIIGEISPHRALYDMHLQAAEAELAKDHERFVHIAGGPDDPQLGYRTYGMMPSDTYARLRSIHAAYDNRVQAAADIMPQLAKPELWADAGQLARTVVELNSTFSYTFSQLRVMEASLQIATHQASSSLVLDAYGADDTMRKL
ncbi:MAG TPA: MBL fold metallo-hydrolase, partial [Kofleriaceae bacterium]|nr:MBL fold metallo-hydrolase [Kofleriaceae bacterium]